MLERTTTRGRVARTASIAAAFLLAGTLGAAAQEEGEEDGGPPPPPGIPAAEVLTDASRGTGDGTAERITTSSTTYDPTVLMKFIAGTGFAIRQGSQGVGDLYDDAAGYTTGALAQCVRANPLAPATAGSSIDLDASIELPDGARIRRIGFFGVNDDAAVDPIEVRLHRIRLSVPDGGGNITRTLTTVDSFTVLDDPGDVETVVFGADDLDEAAGSVNVAGVTEHNFHSVRVRMTNAAGIDHRLCGVEVEYQVPVTGGLGSTFFPVDGYRAYDSRFEMAPVADGRLGNGANRVIPVKDGRNVHTGAINLPDAIPPTAKAVAYTLTVDAPASSGFLWLAPGNAASLNGSSINWDTNTNGALANSGIVRLDSSRQVKVFASGSPGASTHFILDITGYYAAPDLPNMGN